MSALRNIKPIPQARQGQLETLNLTLTWLSSDTLLCAPQPSRPVLFHPTVWRMLAPAPEHAGAGWPSEMLLMCSLWKLLCCTPRCGRGGALGAEPSQPQPLLSRQGLFLPLNSQVRTLPLGVRNCVKTQKGSSEKIGPA